ncbi:MAG: zinc metallopeptidase [Chloroflexota bacterium]|nr:zinc metallopeptidase [Chloroflexota bacterium]
MFLPMFNPMYYLFALPALLLGMYAQYKVRSAYSKYLKVRNRHNITGYEAAQRLLRMNDLQDVKVREIQGQLSDHYDPRNKTLSLSQNVSRSPSLASLAIVAHEMGHAVQDHKDYMPLRLRAGLVPVVQIGSWLGPILFLAGMFLPVENLSLVGLLLFSGTLVFSLVTLPVEFDASRRAVAMLKEGQMVTREEVEGARSVLSAAALTYVAAAAQAISTILYYVFLLGGFRRRD